MHAQRIPDSAQRMGDQVWVTMGGFPAYGGMNDYTASKAHQLSCGLVIYDPSFFAALSNILTL